MRQCCTVSAICFSLFATSAHALSLGDVEVESKLNEPLVAQIEVLSATAAEIGSLRVGLAGEQDWQRAGLTPQGSAASIRFGFVATGRGNLAITLRTEQAVREPLLVFLLDAAWSSGHLLREYTVFLDPASLVVDQAPPVSAPVIQQAASSPFANPSPRESAPVVLGGAYGPVEKGQSLSLIAESLIQGTDLRRHQMMWALFQLNQAAFTDGNINLLNIGAELQLPSYDEVAAVPPQAATRLVKSAAQAATSRQTDANADNSAFSSEPEQTSSANSAAAAAPLEPEQSAADEAANSKAEEQTEPAEAVANADSDADAASPEATEKQTPAVDKLELLPLEANDNTESNSTAASGSDTGSNASPAASQTADIQAGGQAGEQADGAEVSQRERELTAENALLRERINETEALLKEIRGLLAARSEQLADLQQRLETVEGRSSNVETTTQSSQPIGWFWWLLLVLGLLILVLLVLLLVMLTRRDKPAATASALPTRFQTGHEEPEAVDALDDIAEPTAPSEKPQKAVEPVFSSAPPLSAADNIEAEPNDEAEPETELKPEPEPQEMPKELETALAETESFEKFQPAEAQAQSQSTATAENTTAVVEQRELVDDTPLEFDIGSYVAGGDAAADSQPSAEETTTLPEIDEQEADIEADLAPEPETDHSASAEPEFDVLPSLDDIEPLADPTEAYEPLEAEVAEIETLAESDAEPETDLLEADIPPAVAEEDLETIELDAGLSVPGEGLDEDPAVPAIDNAVDVSDFSGGDQIATKLDLARVYADMGDADEARSILDEVLRDGDAAQQQEAQAIIDSLS
jgi:pilus assembly protein FimV